MAEEMRIAHNRTKWWCPCFWVLEVRPIRNVGAETGTSGSRQLRQKTAAHTFREINLDDGDFGSPNMWTGNTT
jgi:hypothetical protein